MRETTPIAESAIEVVEREVEVDAAAAAVASMFDDCFLYARLISICTGSVLRDGS